jgi:non-specific serine/threonine protein kinase
LAALTDALRPRRLLLVLDNCEHLLDACARLADALLRACPHMRLLATSREALGIAGEAAWRVPSLPVPPVPAEGGAAASPPDAADLGRYAAVRLFADRAAAVRPGFALTAENAPAVAQACARLDGIPLAIELAAARVRVLPPTQLLARLDDRFRLLTGGSRTALARHQTLQATADWSYALLTEPERLPFARLSVFAGGRTLEAAEAVGADPDGDGIAADEVLDLLARLADKSLVLAEAQPHLRGPAQLDSLARLEAEQDNLRAALRWALDSGDAAAGLRLAVALVWFWYLRRQVAEGRAWLAQLLAAPGAAAPDALRARALTVAGELAQGNGDTADARGLLEEGLALARALGDDALVAQALTAPGFNPRWRDDYAAARPVLEEALALYRRRGDRWGIAETLVSLARLTYWQGDPAAARALGEAAPATGRQLGDRRQIAQALEVLGEVAVTGGDTAAARGLLDESLAGFRELGDRAGVASVQVLLGRLALRGGAPAAGAARARFVAGLRAAQEQGFLWRTIDALEGLAAVAAAQGQAGRALRPGGAGAALRDAAENRPSPAERAELERWLAPARGALGPPEAAAAWAAGQAMSLEQAVAAALEAEGGDA